MKIQITLCICAVRTFSGHILDNKDAKLLHADNKDSDHTVQARGYKAFFMLNSAKHEMLINLKFTLKMSNLKLLITTNYFWLNIAEHENYFLLNIAEHENFSANKYENANYCWHFHIY